ncbi:amino acid ABC transporter substrate-binding protein (PAAT family) [Homoserinimonas aerilata]|uniref:Amino acid ABC transporter substrate-binding protein (PAAT family) n=1 Tax=Homoserinimonas aerilata TaxID=1162970 RepID=A0A542YI96_9MICO|nr:ABC transporter substrate-binding protein [Homoserinimonas aerilata]TQL47798.1 amino acid ABC transporter substrate-binding protein (PAAT family) [Homoserinimonas aerilata]
MLRTTRLRTAGIAVATAALLALTACAGTTDSEAPGTGSQTGLETLVDGKLTIATGEPAYSPWVENDDPASGEGFEAAVAYAVAEELGFDAADVVWVRTTFDSVIAPGPKDFDFNLQQFSTSPERAEVVDFSSPYYVTSQAVVSIAGNAGADATSIADLKNVKIGVAAGTTTIGVVKELIDPSVEVAIFNNNEDTVQALIAGQIDVLVTDLPTAFYNAYGQLDDGVLVGQLDSDEGGDEFALLLEKDSPLTAAVTKAVDTLRADGTLDELAATWIADNAGAPVLK